MSTLTIRNTTDETCESKLAHSSQKRFKGLKVCLSILELPATAGPSNAAAKDDKTKKKKGLLPKPRAKRMEGLTRELYSLMGDNAPALALASMTAALSKPKMKDRPKARTKAVPWVWQPFENPARKDGLKLSHWAPKRPDDEPARE